MHWPTHMVALDCESTETQRRGRDGPARQYWRLGVTWYARCGPDGLGFRRPMQWMSRPGLLTYLQDLANTSGDLWVFAHNAAYDCQIAGIHQMLGSARWRMEPPPDSRWSGKGPPGMLTQDSPPYILRCWTHAGGRVTVLDTGNWFPGPLSRLGDSLRLPKLPMPAPDAPDADWMTYCQRDAEIVLRAAERWNADARRMLCKTFPWTLPAAAYQHWSGTCRPKAYHSHVDPIIRQYERDATYGGRVFAWRRGAVGGPVHVLDANSLYGWAMSQGGIPLSMVGLTSGWGLGYDALHRNPAECLAHVRLDSPGRAWPVRRGDRVWWARGRFATWLAGPELAEACRLGVVTHIETAARYKLGDPLGPWTLAQWEARAAAIAKGDTLEADRRKRLLVGLYGKFGQGRERWRYHATLARNHGDRGSVITQTKRGKSWQVMRRYGRVQFELATEDRNTKSFPAVGAWIASIARLRMDRLRDIAGAGNVHWQHTDCIHVNTVGWVNLDRAGEIHAGLGGLKLVGTYDNACYVGHVAVALDGDWKVPSRNTDTMSVAAGVEGPESLVITERRLERMSSYMHSQPANDVAVTLRKSVHRQHTTRATYTGSGVVEEAMLDE